jgi:thiol-disulfide isomerase/thioredoxin
VKVYRSVRRWAIVSTAAPFAFTALCLGAPLGQAHAQSNSIQPKIVEIHYDRAGKIKRRQRIAGSEKNDTHHANAATGSGGVRSSDSLKTIDVNELERTVRYRFGNATLVVFYAAYCPACRKFMPVVAQLARKWRDKGLSVVAVSLDPEPEMFRMYAHRFAKDIEIFRLRSHRSKELSRQASRLGISVATERSGIPVFAVFGREGQLVAESVGSASFENLDLTVGRLLD